MHFWHDPGSISGVHHWWVGGACGPNQDTSHSGLASPNHSNRTLQLSGSCQFLSQVRVGVLSYHLAFKSSHQGRSESKVFLVQNPIASFCWVEASPLLCISAHITILAATIWDWDGHLQLCYWCSSYSAGASSGLPQWDTFRHSPKVSHLRQRNVFHYAGLPLMESLHSREGNGHPHRPLTLAVHIDIREVAEWLPSEMVHLLTTVPSEH